MSRRRISSSRRVELLLAVLLGVTLLADEVEAKKLPAPNKPRSGKAYEERKAPPPPDDTDVVAEHELEPVEAPKQPLVEATATVWAQAGSRSWTGCSKVATEAGKQLFGYGEEINNFRENHHWAIQAGECPNAPEVLAMASRAELLRRFDLPEGIDGKTDLTTLEGEMTVSRVVALAWIDAAEAELHRRRDKRGLGLEYWRARALLSTGDVEGAEQALKLGLREATVEGWKLRRLLALTKLFAGELETALEQANRALNDAPQSLGGDRLISMYVLALVLDRAGDTAGAERHMKAALDMDGDGGQMRALESALPTHERLYLRAYARTVRRESAGALRLWDAYLARPQPEAPERRLAERHRSALQPLPSNLGGPAHVDEGKAAEGSKAGSGTKAP
ncbi:MAG TPA: tetratricopeptide repeat protein [Enhygromyxa sp.]|nr:tetratricopeptide repeat protein [Enhygromyxa sp.]